MDAFYASVEARDNPRLQGRPILVGGAGGRGVVASASYEARAFGITSAMPMAQARRRCPAAIVIAPRFDVYRRVSAALHDILRSVTPRVQPLALDEAFLDVGGSIRLLGPPVAIARDLRLQIADDLGLPASVGVAPTTFLAKLCSQRAKPDGMLHLPLAEVDTFLAELSVRDLWGVGARTADRLAAAGIHSVDDLRATDEAAVARLVGPATARTLHALAHGNDGRGVQPEIDAKGLSAEQTFAEDLTDARHLRRVLLVQCERVARRLRSHGLRARTVTLKVRDAQFVTRTRARTLAVPTSESAVLHPVVTDLLASAWTPPTPVRLLGVGATQLVDTEVGVQLPMFGQTRWHDVERVADRVRELFGDAAITRGALLGGDDAGRRAPSRDDLSSGR